MAQSNSVKLGDITQLQNLSVEYGISFETLPISLRTLDYSENRSNEETLKSTYSLSELTNIESLNIPMNFTKDVTSLSKLSSLTITNYIDSKSGEINKSQLMDLSGLTNIKNMHTFVGYDTVKLPTSLTNFSNSLGYWPEAQIEVDLDYLIHLEVLKLQNITKIVSLPTTLTDFQLIVSKPFELDLTNIPFKKIRIYKTKNTLEHFSYDAEPDEGIMFDINDLKNLKVFNLNFGFRYNQTNIDLGELNLPSTLEKFYYRKDKSIKLKFKNIENTQLSEFTKEKLMKNRKIK
ncbi:hypothetical protein QTN25_005038 [Entamoeba marina]